MIPKIIHYCWFGGGQLPELSKKCIESWKKYCPDYVIKEWNERNFDLNSSAYVKEAYKEKKWAFVSDYVRLYALINEGGVYMDTDVELLKPIDCFLYERAFLGFEDLKAVSTGILGTEKNHPFFVMLLNGYNKRHFYLENRALDLTTNVVTITNKCVDAGLKLNNKKQRIEDVLIYPKDYFSPKSLKTGEIALTENSYAIHHFNGSWISEEERKIIDRTQKYMKKYGNKIGKILGVLHGMPYYIMYKTRELGFMGSIKYIIEFFKDVLKCK